MIEAEQTSLEVPRRRVAKARQEASITSFEHSKTLTEDEVKRRAEIGRIFQQAVALDHEWIRELRSIENETPAETARYVETIESLTFGKELTVQPVGTKGRNGVSRRIYKGTSPSKEKRGTPPRAAYVKPQSEDAVFRADILENEVVGVYKEWNERTKEFETLAVPVNEEEVESFNRISQYAETYRHTVASYYGIRPNKLTIYRHGHSLRNSIEAGTTTVREYIASRINELINFKVVPLTVLRTAEDNHDLYSVQEAVVTTGGNPPHRFSAEEYIELKELGPEHPAAKSFMRLACIDFLLKSLDRAPWNILYDVGRQQFYGIDNGLCLGLSAEVKKTDAGNREFSYQFSLDYPEIQSLPMEITQMHDGWKLDDETHASLKNFYEKCIPYLEKMEAKPESFMQAVMLEEPSKNPDVKYCAKFFNLLYNNNEKIASREFLNFIQRMEYLVDNRRPPYLKIGSQLSDYSIEKYEKVIK